MPGIFEHRYNPSLRNTAIERRHQQLSPALSRLAANAILAYDSLRPVAKPIKEADDDEPVVLEDFELGGKVVGRYVRLRLGEHHRLNFYDNRKATGILSYSWQFSRVQPVEALKTETTRITKFPANSTPDAEELIDIQVDTHVYEGEIGQGMKHDDYLCSPLDHYHSAEQYIEAFEADIKRAVSEFGA